MKHKKIKNTGILYETLMKRAMAEVEGDGEHKAYNILKAAFGKDTEIRKEYTLYKNIFDFQFNNNKVVENSNDEFVEYVINEYKNIDRVKLADEKYKLVSKIKKEYGDINDFLTEKIDDYQMYASIYKLIETSDIKEKQKYGFAIFEKLNEKKSLTESKKETSTIRDRNGKKSLVKEHRELITKYNQTYATVLSNSQIRIIESYVNNTKKFSKEFKRKLHPMMAAKLRECIAKTDNEIVRIKLNEATDLFDNLQSKSRYSDDDVAAILQYQNLIQQYKNIR